MTNDSRARQARILAISGVLAGSLGAIAGLFEPAQAAAPFALALGVLLVGIAAWLSGTRPMSEDEDTRDEDTKFRHELAFNSLSIALTVVFLLLALVEALAIPAAFGQLEVFGQFALGFVSLYPFVIALLLGALSFTVLIHSRTLAEGTPEKTGSSYVALAATGILILASLVVAAGAFDGLGVKSERSVFVLAAALVGLFFFLKSWLQLPTYGDVTDWLERDQRLQHSGILRVLVFGFLVLGGLTLVLALVSGIGIGPADMSLAAVGIAMLSLLAATFNVGVSHVVPRLEVGMENAADLRKKRRVILNAASIGLMVISLAVAALTGLALLAQAANVEIFNFLLESFVGFYPVIFSIALVPLMVVVYLRTRVQTEVKYNDQLKALAMGLASVTIILVFFGVFIGSGFAKGTGIEIENAVLVMGAAILTLIHFVKARALLPSMIGMMKDAIKTSSNADVNTQESIKKRMLATYIGGLLFVLSFTSYLVATQLGVVEAPQSSLGTDLTFFIYLLVGIVLLLLVVMRYFQNVNIDPRWANKREKEDIGKRRLTSAQVTRYLILGFSIGTATILFAVGLLVQFGVLTTIGPIGVEKKYATDFFVFALLVGMGPYGWYHARESARIGAINQKFPEFLRDLAESQRSGMTLTEAVVTASKGDYGVLTGELRKMAAQVEWGVSFPDALDRFGRRVDTQLIKRTVSLVIQASNAGGNVVDVLTAAADDSREIQMILKERKQSMSIYVMIIYIAFFVFIGVIAVLNAQFIPEVAKAVEKADGVSIGGLNFRKFDVQEFKTLFFHAAIIQGFGGGLVAGVMSGGKPVNGLSHSCVLISIGWVLFRLIIG